MAFIDELEIIVEGGRGGNGCVSFRREKYVPKGGPDGGDGGKGGDVILKGSLSVNDFSHLSHTRIFKASSGKHGMSKKKKGASGEDLILLVPVGTQVFDVSSGELVFDICQKDQEVIVARGGKGGKGNVHFATSTNQIPRYAQKGEEGQRKKYRLELKLIADVGIIGKPNAGKSSLLGVLTRATPKIGPFPFTTLTPELGVIEKDYKRLILADIPGLIEGASRGKGLGIKFLKHIERTKILLHIIDISLSLEEIIDAYYQINYELEIFNSSLMKKLQIIALNKIDLDPNFSKKVNLFKRKVGIDKVFPISTFDMRGLKELKDELFNIIHYIS